MAARVYRVLILFVATIGYATALECLSCTWDAKNDTTDHDCLGSPWKVNVETCLEELGKKYACQTYATFTGEDESKSLNSLERSCASIHSNCNNACLGDDEYCWMCCTDADKCNSFPLQASITYTSSAPRMGHVMRQVTLAPLFVLATAWLHGSFGY